MKTILHIDFNSYFASVEQQANPRLREKPIGVTGGDRSSTLRSQTEGLERTVLGTASVEAKRLGVKTGMGIWEAKKVCPNIIIVPGDSDKYLATTTKFLNILKNYSPKLEVFSIDEAFLELSFDMSFWQTKPRQRRAKCVQNQESGVVRLWRTPQNDNLNQTTKIAHEIKQRIKSEIGDWITCSIGISYNKLMAKLAGSLQKPDGLVVIPDQKTAMEVLDRVELDDICGIGPRIKKRLFNLGIKDFKTLRKVPKELLLASFKSYGEVLYNMARGIDHSLVVPFFEREEVKSVGHRHTLDHNTSDPQIIKQVLLKISEMVAARLRSKKLIGKTIHFWYRSADFLGNGMQQSFNHYTNNGLQIFHTSWEIFHTIWQKESIRMIGVAASNLKPALPANLPLLPQDQKQAIILETLDRVNNKFGNFTLQRASLLGSCQINRKPNPYLSDRRFKI